ncbi:double-strand break repair protein AddB [Rhodopila sp.]|uniref:double-strand break repair protein AddB n=1 Tax=Rhodopila sp. TaxID=2480087 RepID=UPI003D0CA0FF
MALNLFAVPPHVAFLDALASGWLARCRCRAAGDDPLGASRGLILLPTRRSARALAQAFLRVADGRPLLLPRIVALGALDETPLALAGALDLPPAVDPMQRLAALTALILALRGDGGAPRSADRAWLLAGELAALMDEAERAEIDLAVRLPDAADPEYAAHWARTLKFLHIVTGIWPTWLADNAVMNPAARQVALLAAQAREWQGSPPADPVLIAGTTAGIPAVARLLRVVARMPNGQVVLPQLDLGMAQAAWDELEPSHAQAGLARLLVDLDATRGDVRPWDSGLGTEVSGDFGAAGVPRDRAAIPPARFAVLSRALLPAAALHDWMDRAPVGVDGLSRLRAADQQQEALAIALVLRQGLETPGASAALVTPDRDLAGRVAAALQRFGIVADDSAGEPLADTPPGVFLRLLVRAVAEELAPVPLLALLKHPLSAAGISPIACRDAARRLETLCLRGPRPNHGIAGLRLRAELGGASIAGFLARLEVCLAPLLRIDAAMEIAPKEALGAVIEAAEHLAATNDTPGPARLWAGEEGEALATRLAAVRDAVRLMPDLRRGVLPGLLDAILEGEVVRSRRAVRGRGGTEHPRIFIWGLLEARLQSVDVAVLGGLAEGVWPPIAEPGPWLSRPMRERVGLPAPEQAVGQAAHDFLAACCLAPKVVLSCPVRRDNAPAVPARWLTRLDMFLAGRAPLPDAQSRPEQPAAPWSGNPAASPGQCKPPGSCALPTSRPGWVRPSTPGVADTGKVVGGRAGLGHDTMAEPGHDVAAAIQALPEHQAVAWARAIDLPVGSPAPVRPPRPCPPVAKRPRQLSVTAIETWLRDPYAIHARFILRLRALKPLDEATDAADYGSLVHDGLHRFLRRHGAAWPADAGSELRLGMAQALGAAGLRQALVAWWSPRLERIADWVADTEAERRATRAPVAIATEAQGAIELLRPGGQFRLTGRPDRIERYDDASLAILDYKTGTPPSQKDVEAGLAPQLLLEAAMALDGGFGPDLRGTTATLLYWRLSGGLDPGESISLYRKSPGAIPDAVIDARDHLCALIDAFDQPDRAYLSRPHPGLAPRFSDYEQLARVAEWSAAGQDDD